VPVVAGVGVRTLHEDAALTLALSINLSSHVEQVDAAADVPARSLYLLIPVNVRQQAQAEPVLGARVREPVHDEAGLGSGEDLPHSVLHLVVADRTPVRWLVEMDGDSRVACMCEG